MSTRIAVIGMLLLATALATAEPARGPLRLQRSTLDDPFIENWVQHSGSIAMNENNMGTFGNWFEGMPERDFDPCPPNQWAPQCEFPDGSNQQYLFVGALWIGAIIDDDGTQIPRVSVAWDGWFAPSIEELFPGEADEDGLHIRSNEVEAVDCFGNPIYDPTAKATMDVEAVFTDTLTDPLWVQDDLVDGPHEPLGLKVTRRTLGWNVASLSDFVIFEYTIRNIGLHHLYDVYVGHYIDADCGLTGQLFRHTDDITGFLSAIPATGDAVSIAYAADNDGRPAGEPTAPFDVPHVAASSALSRALIGMRTCYNWWIPNANADYDFGPAWADYATNDSLNMGWTADYGTPVGDVHKYQMMSNGEIDYDQIYVNDPAFIAAHPQYYTDACSGAESIHDWAVPNVENAADIADGFDTRYLLSWGPLGIPDFVKPDSVCRYRLLPGEEFTFTVAYILGENFHDPNNPQPGGEIDPTLFDFTDLIENWRRAQLLHDNGYNTIVARPRNFHPVGSLSEAVVLEWSPPVIGTALGYELFGIAQTAPEDTVGLSLELIANTRDTVLSLVNGDDWRFLLRTIAEDLSVSGYADTLVRVGAVLPIRGLAVHISDGTVILNWPPTSDPSLTNYLIARRSETGDSLVFSADTNQYIDETAISGVQYDYWVLAENTRGVISLPANPVHVLPWAPHEEILLIEESRPLTVIDSLLGGISPDSVRLFYSRLLSALDEEYDYLHQNLQDDIGFSLQTLGQYDLVIWHSEANRPQPSAQYIAAREALFQSYMSQGGRLLRVGRRLLGGALNQGTGIHANPNVFYPLSFDSVYAAPAIQSSTLSGLQFSGATSVNAGFLSVEIDPAKLQQISWAGISPGYLPDTELYWPHGTTQVLYTVNLTAEDTSDWDGEPCVMAGAREIVAGFPLYFLRESDASQFLQRSIAYLRGEPIETAAELGLPVPDRFALQQNYPNPFNPTTTIAFSIPEAGDVLLRVYDITGREVATLLNGHMEGGEHSIEFNANNLASGIYFYRLQTGAEHITRKMVLIR